MSQHAFLSPSAAHRWMKCTKSAHLEAQFPDKENDAANEGILAHRLAELILKEKLRLISKKGYAEKLAEIVQNKFCDNSMVEHCQAYADFVLEKFNEAKTHTSDAAIFLEHKLDLTGYIPDGFGTSDAVIIADGLMEIIDLKYGKGVEVSAEDNPQMRLYALGALNDFDYIYLIDRVRMTIYQPRIDNYSSDEISIDELKGWGEGLKVRAKKAFNNEGEFVPGSHCKFCKAKPVCKALANYNLELAMYDFAPADTLIDADIADILKNAEMYKDWLKAVEEYAYDQAVNHGKKWPGYKLVEGRSNRKYADEGKVEKTLIEKGFAEDSIFTRELLGITAMEKFLGKLNFSKYLADLITKPPGKPTLVPESDKRPEFNSIDQAKKDFS